MLQNCWEDATCPKTEGQNQLFVNIGGQIIDFRKDTGSKEHIFLRVKRANFHKYMAKLFYFITESKSQLFKNLRGQKSTLKCINRF